MPISPPDFLDLGPACDPPKRPLKEVCFSAHALFSQSILAGKCHSFEGEYLLAPSQVKNLIF